MSRGNFAERLPIISELIVSINTSAFVGTDPTKCPQLPSGPSSDHNRGLTLSNFR